MKHVIKARSAITSTLSFILLPIYYLMYKTYAFQQASQISN